MMYAVGFALVCHFKVKMRDLFFSLKRGQNLVFNIYQRFSSKVYQRNKIKTKLVNQFNRKTYMKRDKVELKAIKEGAVSYASLEKRLSYMRSL
ncbi:unnamed protein product [Brassica oleracea var. botrytis]|uniref:(rape) hypothetical protein n=1 Tax=Brassica napus TaxID=3708 RepID=A0A816R9T9_BRANA|nr:unnamed protein product [Brassica napus]